MKKLLNLLKRIASKKKRNKFEKGDIVVFNETGEFGNEHDSLLHIGMIRYGTCTGTTEKKYWYSGYLLKMGKYASKGLPSVPMPYTTLHNAPENQLKSLWH